MAAVVPAIEIEATETHQCPQCGHSSLAQQLVKSAFWHSERLVVVDNIPALVCGRCGERFYDDATVTTLDIMQGGGFPPGDAMALISVPVYSFDYRTRAEPQDPVEAKE